jgi:hypothetical protein
MSCHVPAKYILTKSVEIAPDGTILAYLVRPLGGFAIENSAPAMWVLGPKEAAADKLGLHTSRAVVFWVLPKSHRQHRSEALAGFRS